MNHTTASILLSIAAHAASLTLFYAASALAGVNHVDVPAAAIAGAYPLAVIASAILLPEKTSRRLRLRLQQGNTGNLRKAA